MFRRLRSNGLRLLLVSALLWAQAAVAQHSVDHLWHDVTELCQVLVNADHSKLINADVIASVPEIAPRRFSPSGSLILIAQVDIPRHARSPPC